MDQFHSTLTFPKYGFNDFLACITFRYATKLVERDLDENLSQS